MHGTMKIMDPTGHTTVRWDPDVAAEVAGAKSQFDAMTAKGYRAFAIRGEDQPGRPMRNFDAEAGEMILMVAPLQGG